MLAPTYLPLHVYRIIFFPSTMSVASRRDPPLLLLIFFCIAPLSLLPARLFPSFPFLIFLLLACFPSLHPPPFVSALPCPPPSPVVFVFLPPFLTQPSRPILKHTTLSLWLTSIA